MSKEKSKFSLIELVNSMTNYDQFKDTTSGSFTNEHAVKGQKHPNASKLPDNTTNKRCLKHMGL